MRARHHRKKKGGRNKKKQQTVHAVQRAAERYDVEDARLIIPALVWKIQHNEGKLLERQTNRVSLWNVEYADTTYRVVYDCNRGTIASFLPPQQEGSNGNLHGTEEEA